MKNITIVICLLLALVTHAQGEKFEYGETGLNDFVVTSVENISQEDIYNKTVNWIKETYLDPEKVVKMQIENEKIRIVGIAKGVVVVKKYLFDVQYVIEIAFKNERYKFDVLNITYNNNTDYKNIPNFKTDKKYSKIKETPVNIENYFNSLNANLKSYILGKKKDDW